MAIYISKNAVNNIPDEVRSRYSPVKRRALASNHFKNSSIYTNLARQGQGADFLEEGAKGTHIRSLQTAINAVSAKNDINQDLVVDGVFGPKTKNAIINLQEFLGVENTGVINSETLLEIDRELASEIVYNTLSGEVYNENGSEAVIAINNTGSPIQTYVQADDRSEPGPTIKNGQPFNYTQSNNSNYGIVAFDNTIKIDIENPALNQQNKFFIKKDEISFSTAVEQPEPGAELITVQPGESLISIIYDKYYGEEYHILKQPNLESPDDPRNDQSNPDNIIHTFPIREIEKDTRLKFIVNLLLYMNSDEDQNIHNIQLSSPYKRYTDEDIDELNIYDNEGYNLNYQLYLEKLQAKDPEYQWEFKDDSHEVNGRQYSFKAPIESIEGKQLWLPSRTYVEGLYYALNIQPKVGRMYKKVTVPDSITPEKPEGDSFLDWVEENVFEGFIDIVSETLDTVEGLADEVVKTVIATYREAREYFSKMYNWFITSMNDIWLRGFGAQLSTDFAITAPIYGVPLGLKTYETAHIWRNVTPQNQFIVTLFEKSIIEGGIDAGVGPELVIGAKKKKGASKVGSGNTNKGRRKTRYGVTASAGAEALLGFETRSIYEFDIAKSNAALIAMGIAMLDNSTIINSLTQNPISKIINKGLFALVDYFISASIDPEEYLIQWDAGVYAQGRVYAEASVEFGSNSDSKFSNDKGDKKQNLKSGGLLALFKKLGFTANTEAFVKFGGKFTYKAEFKNLPDVHEESFRMPSKVSLEGEVYAEAGLSLNVRFGSFITRFITGIFSTAIPIIPSLNLHTGIAFLLNFEYERKTTPDQHNFFNHTPASEALYGVLDPNNNITKTVGLKLTTGSLDDPLGNGSELSFWLEFAKLKEYFIAVIEGADSVNGVFTNFETFLELFNKMTIRKKLLIGDGVTNRNSIRAKKMVTNSGTKLKKHYKNFIDVKGDGSITDIIKGLISFSVAIDVEATFEMKEIIQTVKFIYKYLQLIVSENQFIDDDKIKYKIVVEKISKIVREVTEDIAISTPESSVAPSRLTDIYTSALMELETIYADESFNLPTQNLRSYINIIGDFIKMMDQEGLLSTTAPNADEVVKTVSPQIREVYSIMKSSILFLMKKSKLNFYMEGNLTGSLAGGAGLGAGTKARIGFSIEAGIYNRTDLIKDGEHILEFGDTYFDLINDILSIFGSPSVEQLANNYEIGLLLASNSANENQKC